MRRLVGVGIAAGTAAVVLGGGATAALAATPSSTPSPTAAHKAHHRGLLRGREFGEVTTITTSGGALGSGQLVIKQPDGNSLTLNLTSKTRVRLYQGDGTKPTTGALSFVTPKELVAVAGRTVAGTHFAGLILDLGFQAS